MINRVLPVVLVAGLLGAAALVPAVLAPQGASAAPNPQKLVDAYFKAKKDKDRTKAWAAIEAAEPLALDEKAFVKLRDRAIEMVRKRGRKLESGRNEWFDEKKDDAPGKGLYISLGKGKKGFVLALHGGGAGSGDCGSSASQFGGPISGLKMRGVAPEVLVKTEHGWTDPPDTERWVLELLKAAARTWKIPPNRFYVTGHSMGGYGTWTYGAIHADVFAAGAAFAGAPSIFWKAGKKDIEAEGVYDGILPNLYNLPLFVYQSLDDVQVKAPANVFACARLKEFHESDPEGWEYVYEQVDGRGHGFPDGGPKGGLEWMAAHEREPRPVKIRWQPVRDWKKTFYWLRWEKPWLGANLVATVDKAKNAIDVTVAKPFGVATTKAEAAREGHVSTLSFYVDERLVDMEREIVVTVDGKERFRGLPERSLATFVRTAEEREDPEYVFSTELKLGPLSD